MSRRLFAGLALALLALTPPLNAATDGGAMLDVALSFVYEGNLDVTCTPKTVERMDGTCFSTFYLLESVVLVPFVALGRLIGAIAGTPATYASEAVAMILPPLVTAAAGTLVAILVRERGAGPRTAVLAALAYVFGTEAFTTTRTLLAEPLGAACLVLCTWGLLAPPDAGRGRRAASLVGAALVVMTKPQLVFAAPFAGVALSLHDRRLRPAQLAIAGTAIGTLAVLAYNWHRFGSALSFGGAHRRLYIEVSSGAAQSLLELLEGAVQLLFSLNHGLLYFAPVALLGLIGLLRRPIDRVAAVCLGAAVGVFGFAMIVPDGQFWGTRYLVPLLPLACVGIAGLGWRAKRVAVALALVAALSQTPNLVSYPERVNIEAGLRSARAWDVHRIQLIDVWPAAAHQLRDARRTDPASLVHAEPEGRLLRLVAQWWWMLPAIGIPRLFGAGLSLILLACAVLLVRQAIARPRNRSRPVPPFERAENP